MLDLSVAVMAFSGVTTYFNYTEQSPKGRWEGTRLPHAEDIVHILTFCSGQYSFKYNYCECYHCLMYCCWTYHGCWGIVPEQSSRVVNEGANNLYSSRHSGILWAHTQRHMPTDTQAWMYADTHTHTHTHTLNGRSQEVPLQMGIMLHTNCVGCTKYIYSTWCYFI